MEQKEIRFQKVRDLSQVISDSFNFLKQEIRPLSKVILIYVLPFAIVYAGAQVYFQRNVLSHFDLRDTESIMANIGPFYLNLLVFMFFGIFIQTLLAGTYFTYIDAYVKHGRNGFSVSDISGHFFSNSLLALGAALVYTIAIFTGALFCLVPGIYLANTLSLLLFIVIFQKKGLGHALSYSWKLVNSQWWNTLAINVIGILIVYAVGLVFSIPTMIMGIAGSFTALATESPLNYPNWYWLLTAVSSMVTTILLVIPYTFQAFQYFNLEERMNPGEELM